MSAQLTMVLTNFAKRYYAVFFEDSMIIAFIDKPLRKALDKEIKKLIKENKIKLFQRGQFTKDYWEQYGNKYLKMTKEDILMEDANNIEIEYENIEKFALSPYRTHAINSREDPPIPGEIWIEEYSKKHHYNHPYKIDHPIIGRLKDIFQDKYIQCV